MHVYLYRLNTIWDNRFVKWLEAVERLCSVLVLMTASKATAATYLFELSFALFWRVMKAWFGYERSLTSELGRLFIFFFAFFFKFSTAENICWCFLAWRVLRRAVVYYLLGKFRNLMVLSRHCFFEWLFLILTFNFFEFIVFIKHLWYLFCAIFVWH